MYDDLSSYLFFMIAIVSAHNLNQLYSCNLFYHQITVEPDFSKLFETRKNVYYCQVFTIYHVIYIMIVNFGKQQKVY